MKERADVLAAMGAALAPRAKELDETVPAEAGIPCCFFPGSSGLTVLDFCTADLGQRFTVEEHRPGRPQMGSAVIRRSPAGVVVAIVPWNGPVMQILMKLAPALVAGCTIVVKTAPETPLSSYAPLPRRWWKPACPRRGQHPPRRPRHRCRPYPPPAAWTGSRSPAARRPGAQIAAECAPDLRQVNLELGGKSAAILLEDVDLEAGLPTAITCGLFYNGEACSALTRMLVPRSLLPRGGRAHGGPCRGPAGRGPTGYGHLFIGPMVSERQRAKVEEYVALGRHEGARLVTGGGRPEGLDHGWYVEPTVFADVDNPDADRPGRSVRPLALSHPL